ncbi:c-type cytochrome [Aromatoleum toluvorans]|nr:c-type cytochrome [Aromatoleum toluvorans]
MKARILAVIVAGLTAAFASSGAMAVDEDAAKATAKRNDCFKCHAIDKTKKGPSYKKIAAKFKDKADAEQKMVEQITKEHKVKLEDGTEETHKVIDTTDKAEIKNLIDWIRAQ